MKIERLHEREKPYRSEFQSPVGRLILIAGEDSLHAVLWETDLENGRVKLPENLIERPRHPVLAMTAKQLKEYFQGKRTTFDLPLKAFGTPFQQKAWKFLRAIPYGKTVSYEAQALKLGGANFCRAVGTANGKNPISIIVPCHRVIGKNGSLTGFAGGLSVKEHLLKLEAKN